MRRALIAAAFLLAALPAPASAAFGELPFRAVSSSAVCLAPTGVPGGLVRWTPAGAELLDAKPAGLVAQGSIPLGPLRSCPVAVVDPGGAGVAAGAGKGGVRVVARDPGGTWSAPVAISSRLAGSVSAAVSPRGDAVVAWLESDDDYTHVQLKVARRTPGAAFGAPQRVASGEELEGAEVSLDADGAALLVYTDRKAVRVVTAAAGAAFGPARKLIASDFFSDTPALATTPEGRALLAVPADEGTALFERAPGGEFVRRPSIQFGDGRPAVALRSDGTALIVWEAFDHVYALRREGDGPFAAPIEVQPEPPQESSGSNSFGFSIPDEGPPREQSGVRVTLGADGRALLAWPDRETGLHAATITPTGQVEAVALGSPVRPAGGMTPLVLADGSRMVAWTDENSIFSSPPFAGRLHLAVEGATGAPDAAAPELVVGAPRDASLRPAQPLDLSVRCSAACDVRGSLDGHEEASTVSLTRAGTALLRFQPGSAALAPKRGTLKVHLVWSAPGAHTASSRTAAVRLRRLPAPPLPHLLNVRARRGADGVVDVRWSTDAPVRDGYVFVYATRTRDPDKDRSPRIAAATQGRLSRRSFHVRVRDAAGKRYAHVAVAQLLGRPRQRIVSVRIQ